MYSAGIVALLAFVRACSARPCRAWSGLGLNLVSAPVVTMVEPSLMPELLLVLAVLLPFFTLVALTRGHRLARARLGAAVPRARGRRSGVLFLALFSDGRWPSPWP